MNDIIEALHGAIGMMKTLKRIEPGSITPEDEEQIERAYIRAKSLEKLVFGIYCPLCGAVKEEGVAIYEHRREYGRSE